MIPADLFGVNFKIEIASATLFPLIRSITKRALRGEVRTVFAVALAVLCVLTFAYLPQN